MCTHEPADTLNGWLCCTVRLRCACPFHAPAVRHNDPSHRPTVAWHEQCRPRGVIPFSFCRAQVLQDFLFYLGCMRTDNTVRRGIPSVERLQLSVLLSYAGGVVRVMVCIRKFRPIRGLLNSEIQMLVRGRVRRTILPTSRL